MKGFGQSTSTLTRTLAQAQDSEFRRKRAVTPPSVGARPSQAEAMPTLFRIQTEEKKGLAALVSCYFEGATLSFVTGIWRGQLESAVVIELVYPYARKDDVLHLARVIRKANGQEAVLVTWSNTNGFGTALVTE